MAATSLCGEHDQLVSNMELPVRYLYLVSLTNCLLSETSSTEQIMHIMKKKRRRRMPVGDELIFFSLIDFSGCGLVILF